MRRLRKNPDDITNRRNQKKMAEWFKMCPTILNTIWDEDKDEPLAVVYVSSYSSNYVEITVQYFDMLKFGVEYRFQPVISKFKLRADQNFQQLMSVAMEEANKLLDTEYDT